MRYAALVATALLAGCQQQFPPTVYGPRLSGGLAASAVAAAPAPSTQVHVDDDPFESAIVISTDPIEEDTGTHTMISTLNAYVDRQSRRVEAVTVHISDVYTARAWTFWNRATGRDGVVYDVITVHRDVHDCYSGSGCIYSESLIAELPGLPPAGQAFEVKAHADAGGGYVAAFPAPMVDAFLDAVQATTAAN